jgi:glycosyltransferase involved in cell wall biosynthesis
MLSIIVIAKNNVRELNSTIQSIIDYIDDLDFVELIVIDASSQISNLSKQANHFRNYFYVNEIDKGIFHGMNKGLAMARGNHVWFLNAGDTIPNSIDIMELEAMLEESEWCVGRALKLDIKSRNLRPWKIPKSLGFKLYFGVNSYPHQSTIYQLSSIRRINGFQENSYVADWEASLNLHRTCTPVILEKTLSVCESGGFSERIPLRLKAIHQTKSRQRVYRFGFARFYAELFLQLLILVLVKMKKSLDVQR